MKGKNNFLQGNALVVYLANVLPVLVGLLIMSSATIIDALFVGNYVGANALAAVNLVSPLMNIMLGFSVMLVVGASVKTGKYLGENNIYAANQMFSKAIIIAVLANIFLSFLGHIFINQIVNILGANQELYDYTKDYVSIILLAPIFIAVVFLLFYFVRIDGRSSFASFGLALTAIFNIIFDWYFITKLSLGVKGAALATLLSYIVGIGVLLSHYFFNKGQVKFTYKIKQWKEVFVACYNGISEFFNEISVGIVILLFNNVIIKYLGVDGVVAFTIVNYFLMVETLIVFAFSDAFQLIVSVNYGARNFNRIKTFMNIARVSVLSVGIICAFILVFFSKDIISIFVKGTNSNVASIATNFAYVFWVAFIFNGFNMLNSAYHTALQNPKKSLLIALSRSFVFPLLALFCFPLLLGLQGIYIVVPFAELVTFIIAFVLYKKYCPSVLHKTDLFLNSLKK